MIYGNFNSTAMIHIVINGVVIEAESVVQAHATITIERFDRESSVPRRKVKIGKAAYKKGASKMIRKLLENIEDCDV